MNFKLSDAISKLETMEQNEVLPFASFDGYPETVESFKMNLEEIMDLILKEMKQLTISLKF